MMPSEAERLDVEQLGNLESLLRDAERPRLVGREGFEIEIPDVVFHHLLGIVRAMGKGQRIHLIPDDEEFTTQAAADFLGFSRPHLIKLLDAGELDFRFVGTHRRVTLKDLLAYRAKRDQTRRRTLSEHFDAIPDEAYE